MKQRSDVLHEVFGKDFQIVGCLDAGAGGIAQIFIQILVGPCGKDADMDSHLVGIDFCLGNERTGKTLASVFRSGPELPQKTDPGFKKAGLAGFKGQKQKGADLLSIHMGENLYFIVFKGLDNGEKLENFQIQFPAVTVENIVKRACFHGNAHRNAVYHAFKYTHLPCQKRQTFKKLQFLTKCYKMLSAFVPDKDWV